MIIGQNLAIGHIPRTGGDTVACMAADIILTMPESKKVGTWIENPYWHLTNISMDEKHDTFTKRGVKGLKIALGIRRLPSYMWAMANFLSKGTLGCPKYRIPNKNEFINPTSQWGAPAWRKRTGGCFATLPDFYMRQFTDSLTRKVDFWIRQESLREDMIELSKEMLGHDPDKALVERLMARPTKRPYGYDHDWSKQFSREDIDAMYHNNPIWAECEKQAYDEPRVYEYSQVEHYPQGCIEL